MFVFKSNLVFVAAVLAVVCVSVPSTHAEGEQEAEGAESKMDGVAQYMGYGSNGLGYGYNPQPNQYMVPPYPYGGNQGGNIYGGNGYPPGYNPGYNQGYNPGYPGNYPINHPGYNPGYPSYNQYAAEGGEQAEVA